MPKMTTGPARRFLPGMTAVSKHDIRNMKPSVRNRLRGDGFTWAQIKRIDDALGRGERQVRLKSRSGEVVIDLSPLMRRAE